MHRFGRAAALWTGSARPDGVHVEFVINAVLAGIGSLVDVAVFTNLTPESLYSAFVALGRGADEIVIRETHPIP
jgi:hypothetical protein